MSTSTSNPNLPSTSNLKNPPPSSSQGGGAASSSSSAKPPGSSSSTSATTHHQPQLTAEERLQKEWRTITSNLLSCISKAEKAGKETTKDNCKELDEGVVNYLKMRMMWHRLMSHVQAKIQGKEEEMAALENYVRTQPKLGLVGKKRKRQEETPNIFDATAAATTSTATGSAATAVGGSSTATATPPPAAAIAPQQPLQTTGQAPPPPPGDVNPL